MPPTYSPWLDPFDKLARIGSIQRRSLGSVLVGIPNSADCLLGSDWFAAAASSAALYDVWSPPQTSPWSAYHRPTLFASLDSIELRHRWPSGVPGMDPSGAPAFAPHWADARTAILLDLPAETSVSLAAWLSLRAGHQPVSTFNNWPHEVGVVPMAPALAALLFYTPWAKDANERRRVGSYRHERAAPPVFMLDSRRLGPRPAARGTFDNRYYLLDSDLPSGATLRRHGIERLVYVNAAPLEGDDLNETLREMGRHVRVHRAAGMPATWALGPPEPFQGAPRKTPFNTTTDPAFKGFRRAAAGGFGRLVPESSSGGG